MKLTKSQLKQIIKEELNLLDSGIEEGHEPRSLAEEIAWDLAPKLGEMIGSAMVDAGVLDDDLPDMEPEVKNALIDLLAEDMLEEKKDDEWIQDAEKDIERRGTEGVCTGDKFGSPSCPEGSKRYNLAKTFRKMAKKRKKK
jgi:hypothetical protein